MPNGHNKLHLVALSSYSQNAEQEAIGDSLGTYVQHVGGAGLVYNVTEYLFGHGINIENLETHTEEVLASLHFQHLSSNV
jgi:glycine cleavage system regulatory protein